MSAENTYSPTPEQVKALNKAGKILTYGGLAIVGVVVGLRIKNEGFEDVAVDTCLSALNGAAGCAVVGGAVLAAIAPEGQTANAALEGAIGGAKFGGFWGAVKGAMLGRGNSSETE